MEPYVMARPVGSALKRSGRVTLAVMAAAAVVATTVLPASAARTEPSATGWRDVVVTGGTVDGAARAVASAGGTVISALPVVLGVAARLPLGAYLAPEWLVAPQRELRVAATPAAAEPGATSTVRQSLGLPDDGDEGRGVTVAVVDTGIAAVPDLAGQVSRHVDLTGTGAGDGFGHGTFMAGLIAGSGAASGGAYRGVAPAAKLIDVKVADAQGNTDLITVLRGLQWVSEHAGEVDVVNLSLSSDSPLPYQIDPLTQGLEALWRRGITVVVPSGNAGSTPGSVTSPGADPVLLTVGGLDESGTAARGDDTVAEWSGRGPTWQGDAKPDLVAAGAHLISLRSPGSVVDTGNASARIGDQYFRGSGTSMASAVTSGIVAATLAVKPNLRPDAIKQLITSNTYAATGITRAGGAGAGALDAARVLAAAPSWHTKKGGADFDRENLAIGRDAKHWTAFEKALLTNDRAAAAAAWAKLSPESREWAARTWSQLDPAIREWAARTWAGRAWAAGPDGTAEQWAARTWAARTWAGRAWAGRAWADFDWSGRAWAGRAWADFDWSGRAWAGRAWAGRAWAGRAWADFDWSGRAWADVDWTGRAWAGQAWSARAWAWLQH